MSEDLQNLRLKSEYEADQAAAHAAACAQCSREEGDWYFGHCKDTKGLTLKKLQSMGFDQLTKHISDLEPQTIAYCKTGADCHPLNLERALRFYRYGLCEGIAGRVCSYHALDAKKEAGKAIKHAEYLKEAAKIDAAAKARRANRFAHMRCYAAAAGAGADAKQDAGNKKAEPVNAKPATPAQQPAAGAQAAAEPKPSPVNVKAEAELFTQEQLFAKKYRHKTVDTVLGKPVNQNDGWDFEQHNKFIRGEVVSVLRSSDTWTYGVVVNHDAQGVMIQIELDGYKLQAPEVVGKNIG